MWNPGVLILNPLSSITFTVMEFDKVHGASYWSCPFWLISRHSQHKMSIVHHRCNTLFHMLDLYLMVSPLLLLDVETPFDKGVFIFFLVTSHISINKLNK